MNQYQFSWVVFRRGNFDQQRTWNALRVALGGTTGLIALANKQAA
jgi:hypothetical protein